MAHFKDLATITGYDIAPANLVVRPGNPLTLTLNFRAQPVSAPDLVRFVHLAEPAFGMVAQHDSPPQDGGNPTWSWVTGETVRDHVTLFVPATARAGTYTLSFGFYDPQAGGTRLPVSDEHNSPLPDAQVVLTQVKIAP